MRIRAILFLVIQYLLTPQAHAYGSLEKTYARAVGIVGFYAEATKLMNANGDTLSVHDFNALLLQIKNELNQINTIDTNLIIAQINDSNSNAERLEQPKKWLGDLAQTLYFAQSRLEYLLYRYQLENGIRYSRHQIKMISNEASAQGFIELVSPHNDRYPGSFIHSTPFKNDKFVKNYLIQILNNQAMELSSTPQLDNPINSSQVDVAAKQAANLQFQYRQKVSRNVSSM
jgi:hypothetical protein